MNEAEVLVVDTVLGNDQVMQLCPGDLLVVRVDSGSAPDVHHIAQQLQNILPNVQVMVCHQGVQLGVVKAPRVEAFVESLQGIVQGLI